MTNAPGTKPQSTNRIILKVKVESQYREFFIDWQTKFNRIIAGFPGFISLEILSPRDALKQEWLIIQKFQSNENVDFWKSSPAYHELLENLQNVLGRGKWGEEIEPYSFDVSHGVTEVIVTEVNPEKENEYREWLAKIHQVEAAFHGFQGTYVQSPRAGYGKNWITLLQFDTPENLDNWLNSQERQEILNQSKSLIKNLETHRVESPYGGWFSSIAKRGFMPAVWKQTMLVLLVLYPVVMLEIKHLNPLLSAWPLPVSTFIGNAISVTLIAWPLMPIAIWFLAWWLSTQKKNLTIVGALVVIFLYLLEIWIFSLSSTS